MTAQLTAGSRSVGVGGAVRVGQHPFFWAEQVGPRQGGKEYVGVGKCLAEAKRRVRGLLQFRQLDKLLVLIYLAET